MGKTKESALLWRDDIRKLFDRLFIYGDKNEVISTEYCIAELFIPIGKKITCNADRNAIKNEGNRNIYLCGSLLATIRTYPRQITPSKNDRGMLMGSHKLFRYMVKEIERIATEEYQPIKVLGDK